MIEKFLNEGRVSELWTEIKAAITTALGDYMTAEEVNQAITAAIVAASGIKFSVVDTLPETGEINVIYLVPNNTVGNNVKDEYMWIDGKWELLGSTKVDLTGYWSKEDLVVMTSEELKAILV